MTKTTVSRDVKKKSLDNQLTVKALCFKLVGATEHEPLLYYISKIA
jgi:hypothetical protein